MPPDNAVHVVPILVAAAVGVVVGIGAWVAATFLGRPLARFYDLRRDAHEAIRFYANVVAFQEARVVEGQDALRRISCGLDALVATLPWPAGWFLRSRGYNVQRAAGALMGLSNSLTAVGHAKPNLRVGAQRALKLPVDDGDAEMADRAARLDGVNL